jgi:hypothetical protein
MPNGPTLAQYLVRAMEGRGKMSTQAIYREVQSVCRRNGRPLPLSWQSAVRQILQAHCATRPQYKGEEDFFVWHGRGLWSCKVHPQKT